MKMSLAAAALLAVAGPLLANAGPPASGGQVAGEPTGIRHVRIVRENLVIDLRPVARAEKAAVEATYQFQNDGGRRSLDLLFASGSEGVSGFEVLFDGRPVPAAAAPGAAVPEGWKPPRETPGFGDGRPLEYAPGRGELRGVKPLAFTLVVDPGPHTLTVRYRASTGTNWLGRPNRYHQFAYVLAPARAWDGFGGLDVAVHLPDGWRAAASPALGRDGDTLRGSFADLPADALAVTFQAPEGGWYRPLITLTLGAFWAAGLGGLLAAWWVGRWRGRRAARAEGRPRAPRIWPWAVGVGVVWSFGFLVTGLLAVYGPGAALPEGQPSNYGYGEIFEAVAVFLLAPAVAAAGFAIAYVTGVVVRRMNLPGRQGVRPEGVGAPSERIPH